MIAIVMTQSWLKLQLASGQLSLLSRLFLVFIFVEVIKFRIWSNLVEAVIKRKVKVGLNFVSTRFVLLSLIKFFFNTCNVFISNYKQLFCIFIIVFRKRRFNCMLKLLKFNFLNARLPIYKSWNTIALS